MNISEPDYEKSKGVQTLMRCNNFGDYNDFYLTLDVYLVAHIFEAFRGVCLKEYHLDPVHFFSFPNLSWEGILNTTKVELGLLSDIDMLLFCEQAIRGGINGIGASKPTTNTWKTSINLSHLCLGFSLMSHHSLPERCNSLSHVALLNGETI